MAVQTIAEKKSTLEIEPISTIKSIKNQFFTLKGISPEHHRILHRGVMLDEEAKIKSSHIEEEHILHMFLSLRGGFQK